MNSNQLQFNLKCYTRVCRNCGAIAYHSSSQAARKARKIRRFCPSCWNIPKGVPVIVNPDQSSKLVAQLTSSLQTAIDLAKSIHLVEDWKLVDGKWKKITTIAK